MIALLRTFLLLLLILVLPSLASAGLQVTDQGKTFRPGENALIQQTEANTGGNTSARNTDRANLVWKEKGYYQRNRDLGQVFTAPRDFQIEAIILRTGPADAAVLAGAPGAEVFVQFFEVTGQPRINDNGTPPGTDARHGFTKNHRADDYLEGVTYRPLHLVTGGTFPKIPPTRGDGANRAGRFRYLRWQFTGEDRIRFEAGKQYAFMVGFVEPGKDRGFTLANANAAGADGPAEIGGKPDHYPGGWSLRREGNGQLPTKIEPGSPEPKGQQQKQLMAESMFPPPPHRYDVSPTTDGHPDVDTYRDLEFTIQGRVLGSRE